MNLKTFLLTVIAALFLLITAAGAYYLGQRSPQPSPSPSPSASPESSSLPSTSASPASAVPAGWLTWTSSTYGFSISYPPSYQALNDANNLYGWPNGVVLLYNGGQSYDVVIEIWDNQADYQAKYPAGSHDLTVRQIGSKYLTILNSTQEDQNAAIIDSLTLLTP